MNTIVVVAEHQDEFTMLSANFAHLPIHFSWNKNIEQAMDKLPLEKPFILFAVSKQLDRLMEWLQVYDASRFQIPLVAFTPAIDWADREMLWKTGVSDIVELPRSRKELEYILRAFLLHPQAQEAGSDYDMQGHLQDLNVVDLIRSFAPGRKGGVLVLEKGAAKGHLEFFQGKLVNAELSECDPLESVLVMSLWKQGHFYGNFDSEKRKEQILLDNEQVVIECQNYQKTYQKLLKTLPAWDVVLFTDPDLEYQEFGPRDREALQRFRNGLSLEAFMENYEGNWNFFLKKLVLWLDRKWLMAEDAYRLLQARIKAEARKSAFRKALDWVFSKPEEESPVGDAPLIDSEDTVTVELAEKKESLFNETKTLLQFEAAESGCLEVPVIITSDAEAELLFGQTNLQPIENLTDFAQTERMLSEDKSVIFYSIRRFDLQRRSRQYDTLFKKVPFVLILFQRENRELLSVAKQVEERFDIPIFYLTSKSVSGDVDDIVVRDVQSLEGRKVLLFDSLDADHLEQIVYKAITAFSHGQP